MPLSDESKKYLGDLLRDKTQRLTDYVTDQLSRHGTSYEQREAGAGLWKDHDPDNRVGREYFKDDIADYISQIEVEISDIYNRRTLAPGIKPSSTNGILGRENVANSFKDLYKKIGMTADEVLNKLEQNQEQESKSGAGPGNPLSWGEFNQLHNKFMANIPPMDITETLRNLLQNKASTKPVAMDEGQLDPEKFSTFYTKDVWREEEPSKQEAISIYFYLDCSGSMNDVVGHPLSGLGGKLNNPKKIDLVKQLMGEIISVIHEGIEAGLKIRYAINLYRNSITKVKLIDDDWDIERTLKVIQVYVIPFNGTRVSAAVSSYLKIEPENLKEKIFIFVLTDGDFSGHNDSIVDEDGFILVGPDGRSINMSDYHYIITNPVPFNVIWIPIGFVPNDAESKEVMGPSGTLTVFDVYNATFSAIEKALSSV